ncbi:MAG: dienelactone hydrolase [Hyphococcus sp.]|nr:MAG: dienelactone hydrolase [Marinicaulis sp.]
MKKWQMILLGIVFLVSILGWKAEPLMLAFFANQIEKTSIDERVALIKNDVEIRLPTKGTAPFPVVLQFHGCAGVRPEFQHQWADVATEAGYAAIIVDSMSPRGYSRQKALDIVCSGKALIGQERAGDVLAAIKIVENDPRLDETKIIAAGWSHGAWSLMDYLTLDMKTRFPAGIKEATPAAALKGAIVFYPYCGRGSRSRFDQWKQDLPVLALIAGEDTIVNADECISYFQGRQKKRDGTELVVYPGAEHVFDDPFLEPDYIHWYNEEYFNDAKTRYRRFLDTLSNNANQGVAP